MVRAQPAQARLARGDQVAAREAGVVRAVAHRHARLRGEHDPVAAALDGRADDLLRDAAGVDVGGVDGRQPAVEAEVELARRLLEIRRAHVGELAAPAEGHRAEGEDRDAEAGGAELTMFHAAHPAACPSPTAAASSAREWMSSLR